MTGDKVRLAEHEIRIEQTESEIECVKANLGAITKTLGSIESNIGLLLDRSSSESVALVKTGKATEAIRDGVDIRLRSIDDKIHQLTVYVAVLFVLVAGVAGALGVKLAGLVWPW